MATECKTKKKVGAKSSAASKAKEKKLYVVTFFHKWCKACGLCTALCTKKIIKKDPLGIPYIDAMDSCIGCRFCEIHCPDFAITIKDKHPDRRRNDRKE
jgi:2-oxoglutarate ferredoxin oxidoreductase subunit delta